MEFRCDVTGSWHFSSNCPKWPINPLVILFRERLPHKFEICGQCKTHNTGRRAELPSLGNRFDSHRAAEEK